MLSFPVLCNIIFPLHSNRPDLCSLPHNLPSPLQENQTLNINEKFQLHSNKPDTEHKWKSQMNNPNSNRKRNQKQKIKSKMHGHAESNRENTKEQKRTIKSQNLLVSALQFSNRRPGQKCGQKRCSPQIFSSYSHLTRIRDFWNKITSEFEFRGIFVHVFRWVQLIKFWNS